MSDAVGDVVGDSVGEAAGDSVGDAVGESVRDAVGDGVGDSVGDKVGATPSVGVLLGELEDEVGSKRGGGACNNVNSLSEIKKVDLCTLRLHQLTHLCRLYCWSAPKDTSSYNHSIFTCINHSVSFHKKERESNIIWQPFCSIGWTRVSSRGK